MPKYQKIALLRDSTFGNGFGGCFGGMYKVTEFSFSAEILSLFNVIVGTALIIFFNNQTSKVFMFMAIVSDKPTGEPFYVSRLPIQRVLQFEFYVFETTATVYFLSPR